MGQFFCVEFSYSLFDVLIKNKGQELLQVARQTYGNEVDAVLNMTYDVDQEGEAYGSGLAVRFVEQSPPPAGPSPVPATQNRIIQDRLEELKKICEQELITEADCEAKRKSLVDSL